MAGAKRERSPEQSDPNRVGEGWRTSDEEEIERRRRRARSEPLAVRLSEGSAPFGSYSVTSAEGRSYLVELRSQGEAINSCGCPDFEVNGLGTCKHIEAVLASRQGRRPAPERGRTEIFLDRRSQYDGGPRVRILWADELRRNSKVRQLLEPFFSAGGTLLAAPTEALPALTRALREGRIDPAQVRLSQHIAPFVERLTRERARRESRSRFLADVAAGKRDLTLVKQPLYPYQREGMLHLAFNERAILADEMGLGKTVQAVAACELLRRLRGVERVLVISPVSLKTEWEEQIAKFTDAPVAIIQGSRPERLRRYRQRSFFYLANYEQVLQDGPDMQQLLAPDVVVLDEAQRIKNWQSKTADAVKRLRSHYVFVLTGTPLENRIDDIYSIAQVVDPHLFGPLFRFNRDFYRLDEKGRPIGYRNLDALHRRLRPVLLRRRKEEVEGELPGRTINTYFVRMEEEQRRRYGEFEAKVARLAHKAQRRPLSPEEFKQLQSALACMRMLCDSPYILDSECRIAPKIDELLSILEEQLAGPENKVIIFSEWTGMLELLREALEATGIGYALHTGEVRPEKRREAINRFKSDPDCRLFLSTDAGATGLNLQVANVVVNLDLPWHPARLEQRIARAWRKHQTRPVSVINLVCEESIEHRMLHLIHQKRLLAEGVLEGRGESDMELPSSRKMLIERLSELMGARVPPPAPETETDAPAPPEEKPLTLAALPRELEARRPAVLEQLSLFGDEEGGRTLFAVVANDAEARQAELAAMAARCGDAPVATAVVDRTTMSVIEGLAQAGVLTLHQPAATLHRSAERTARERELRRRQLERARPRLALAERRARMASLLLEGGFVEEAAAPLREALESALAALAAALALEVSDPVTLADLEKRLLPAASLPDHTLACLAALREQGCDPRGRVTEVTRLLAAVGERLERLALEV